MTGLRTLPVDREPSWQSGLTGEAAFPCQRRRLDGYHRQLEMQFDPELGALWTLMRPKGVPCFNLDLLAELIDCSELIEANDGKVDVDGAPVRARYWVVASRAPGVFNYGGDLALFARLAQARDRRGLLHYATLCVDNLHRRITGFHPPMITLALVQGEALGGGFEAVLSNQVIIAERSSTFGFPEILFNLFPGMGAYSFLARLIGARRAEEIITSGALYGAAELAELGIVDVVAEDGQGEAVATGFMKDRLRRHNSYSALLQARRELFPIHRDELMRIATIWVEAALRLESKDLRIMQRLVSAQEKRFAGRDGAIADGEVGDFGG